MATNRRAAPGPSPKGPTPKIPADFVQRATVQSAHAANGLADEATHNRVAEQVMPSVHALEAALGYPVLTYYLTDLENINDTHILHLYEHLVRLGHQEKMGLWISSRGGHTEIPWKIVSLMREYADWWSAVIPYRAHSSATLVALGADEIVMTAMSELGPIDPSRTHPLLPRSDGGGAVSISVQDLRHVLSFLRREIPDDHMNGDVAATIYTKLFEYVHPLAIGALEQSWALAEHVGRQVLGTHLDAATESEKINQIVERFSDGYKSHRYQISRREAREIGLDVRDATPAELDAMWAIYRAYDQELRIDGEAEVNGRRVPMVAAGFMNSHAGTTIGVTALLDGVPQGPSWMSRWRPVQAANGPAGA